MFPVLPDLSFIKIIDQKQLPGKSMRPSCKVNGRVRKGKESSIKETHDKLSASNGQKNAPTVPVGAICN